MVVALKPFLVDDDVNSRVAAGVFVLAVRVASTPGVGSVTRTCRYSAWRDARVTLWLHVFYVPREGYRPATPLATPLDSARGSTGGFSKGALSKGVLFFFVKTPHAGHPMIQQYTPYE